METDEEPNSMPSNSSPSLPENDSSRATRTPAQSTEPECRSEMDHAARTPVIDNSEAEERVGVSERTEEEELAGEQGGDESRSVVAESDMETGVDKCEDRNHVSAESEEVTVKEEDNPDFSGRGDIVDWADFNESVKEETENGATVSKEEREFVEEMSNKDGVDNVEFEDEMKDMQEEDAAAVSEGDMNVVAENVENEKVEKNCVDHVPEETATVSRRIDDDVLEEKDEVRKQEEELNEVDKEAEKVNVSIDGDGNLNSEVEGEELKLNELAEEDKKLNEAEDVVKLDTEETYHKMDEADSKQDEEVNESEGEEGDDEEMNEVAEEDQKLNEAEEDSVMVAREEKDEKMDGADSNHDDEANESEEEEGNDEEMNEVEEEDENVNDESEEEEDDGDDETINEAEKAEEGSVEELSASGSGKRKRGKNDEGVGTVPLKKKKMEENVCFICFDGGELVLCDHRGCDKAYHPSCVDHDEAFFKGKGKWYCGWHLCSKCEKNAYYKCYTCAFSLCKGCIKDGVFFSVRGNKGFCETCFNIVKLIEMNEKGDKETTLVDFDDKSCWEYLFKDYWIDLKAWLSITPDELAMAKHPRKGSDKVASKQGPSEELYDSPNDGGSASDGSAGNVELTASKGRKGKKRPKSRVKERASPSKRMIKGVGASSDKVEWASKELLDFVMHVKNGDTSVHSPFDVQALLLDYIKKNKLRDPRRKSQILCDSRLQHLFGKHRVAHFEMLKLLESHFLLKQDHLVDNNQGNVVDNVVKQLQSDGISDGLVKARKDTKQKSRKKGYRIGGQSNIDDYAAIDVHNINLIYLKRSLVEDLLKDTETFEHKVVGSFMRLRIPGNANKLDLYRLVQVIGTKKADKPYRVGKRTTSFLLEILNLKRIELVSVDAISNQVFTEEECKRLRQSIKCGLLNRLTVGDIQDKAIALQEVRVRDTMESEITRLCHLRDRASDMGKIKELRESVEKLQLLNSPGERKRRLEEISEIHVDPNMNPSHESEDDDTDDKRQDNHSRSRGSSGFIRRERDPISQMKRATSPNESCGGKRTNRELTRNLSDEGFSYKGDGRVGSNEKANDNLRSQGRDGDREIQPSQSSNSSKAAASSVGLRSSKPMVATDSFPKAAQEISPATPSTSLIPSASNVDETQKIWHYKDPSGKAQGPFSIVQLRKWSNAGYFPANLRTWRATEKEEDSILITDALGGNFQAPLIQSPRLSSLNATYARENDNSSERSVPTAVEVPNSAVDRRNSEASLPSASASTATVGQARKSRWSPTPAQVVGSQQFDANRFSASSNGRQPAAVPAPNTQLSHHTNLSSSGNAPPIESPQVQNNSRLLSVPSGGCSASVAAVALDTAALQSLVQTISNNQNLGTQVTAAVPVSRTETNGSNMTAGSVPETWGSASLQQFHPYNSTSVPPQSNAYGNWGNAATGIHNSAASFPTVNPASVSSVQGTPGMVPFVQPQWGTGVAVANNPSMGWMGSSPANTNHGWVAAPPNQAGIPVNANVGWMQGQLAYGNTGWSPTVQVQGWGPAPPGQGSVPINSNQNLGWVGPGNVTNPNWRAPQPPRPAGNMVHNWGNERNNGADGGDRGSRGGDSVGHGDGPWNRQSSFGRNGGGQRT